MRTTKLGILQIKPVFKNPPQSIQQANNLILSLKPNDIDLLMLPEFAFTGYNFRSFEDLEPFIESETDGISVKWAKETAKRLNCHVMIGFPQKINEPAVKQVYNAMAIVSNEGDLLKVYHKTQLYPPVDPLWARPGAGFSTMDLKIGRLNGTPGETVKCCLGICMDLSPDKFEAPFDAYELSSFAVNNRAEVLLCCMAWLDLGPQPDPHRTNDGKSEKEVQEQINHWAMRCEPFWQLENRTFATCNRVGIEDEAVFCGTSCVITNSKPAKKPITLTQNENLTVLDFASKHSPELLIVNVNLPEGPSTA